MVGAQGDMVGTQGDMVGARGGLMGARSDIVADDNYIWRGGSHAALAY